MSSFRAVSHQPSLRDFKLIDKDPGIKLNDDSFEADPASVPLAPCGDQLALYPDLQASVDYSHLHSVELLKFDPRSVCSCPLHQHFIRDSLHAHGEDDDAGRQ